MHHRSLAQKCFFCGLLGLIAMGSTPVFAYVEPGAGNLLLQLLFGGLAGIGLLVKLYWRHIATSFFGWKPSPPETNNDDNHGDTPAQPLQDDSDLAS